MLYWKKLNLAILPKQIEACVIFVGRKVAGKPYLRRENALKRPWRKRRIQQSTQELQKNNILKWKKCGEIKKKEKHKVVKHKCRVKKKRLNIVLKELKQSLQARAPKIKRNRISRLLQKDQKMVYRQVNGTVISTEKPDAEERGRFWSNIWDSKKSCNKNADWLKELRVQKNQIGWHTNNHWNDYIQKVSR